MSSIIALSRTFKKRNLIAGIIAGLSLVSASNAGAGDDPVRAGFQRMLDHQSAPATVYRASRNETDPVQEMVNAALRSGIVAAGNDPVQASFQRMFDHQSASVIGYRAPRGEADPVQEMINTALQSPDPGTRHAPDHSTSLSLND